MEHMRLNMERMGQEMRYGRRRALLQRVSSVAAATGPGVALGVWASHLAQLS